LPKELRIIRTLYWTLWFVVVPLCLALVFVWALTPPSGVDQAGFLGWVESAVREQPVPVAIVAFTLFEMALWAARHELPFARHALPALRAGVAENMRGPFERARTRTGISRRGRQGDTRRRRRSESGRRSRLRHGPSFEYW